MTDPLSKAAHRLTQTKDLLLGKTQAPNSLPWNPDCTSFPLRADLPKLVGCPDDAAWVWGKDDNIGRLNLLTPTRVKAASSQIKTGEMARVDLPLNVPLQPSFDRQTFTHTIKTIAPGVAYDDTYSLNTQSSTQWDGFRHFAHIPTSTFYNNTHDSDIVGSTANDKNSIHHWSTHGFSGRGILLDYKSYAEAHDVKYDSSTAHEITYEDLVKCGKWQNNLDIRPVSQGGHIQIGDILFIRSGFVKDYYSRTDEQNRAISLRGEEESAWTGLKQDPVILDWLHNCYFAAVAGDAPAFEVWPKKESYYMHEYILALWGMPLGEMLDLEKVSQLATKNQRWTFFFASAPANCPGGVGSMVNGTAIF